MASFSSAFLLQDGARVASSRHGGKRHCPLGNCAQAEGDWKADYQALPCSYKQLLGTKDNQYFRCLLYNFCFMSLFWVFFLSLFPS